MSFDKHSNFNKQANFTEVKFGENKPVLEVELNELQQIQNEARADIIRDSIPSGFTQLGDIDYEYCLNNENKIKLKTDSVAYVNGYRINIPKDTIIDIGKAPEKDAREDLVFLEVWKEEVNSTSTLYKEGGEGQVEIPNNIKDSRYPIETTHRVALKWRIRHVAGVDFNSNRQYAQFIKDFSTIIFIQGSLDKPSAMSFVDSVYLKEVANTISDVGLWRCASPRPDLEYSIDGYCYAIPMFRLYRKPSCGKSIPFEYNKINPKADYSKFANLVQDERVEKVEAENVKGASLVNLSSLTSNTLINPAGVLYRFSNLAKNELVTSEKKYTISFEVVKGSFELKTIKSDLVIIEGIAIGKHLYCIQIPQNGAGLNAVITTTDEFILKNLIILEGDWTNKEIPEFFTGLKSLGEDDGNLITIKNGILNDDTYDINDGNQKLNTFPSVTHVLSENTIIPTIEAVVNKGDDSTPLEKLGSKLETEGNEVIEFTKIKGKTIQNLWDNASTVVTISTLYQRLCLSTMELVANKTYTLVVNVQGGAVDFKKFEGNEVIQTLQPGVHVVSYTPNINSKVLLIALGEVGAKYNMKALLLDGDFTNTPLEELPFVEGIKSVGETEDNKVVLKSFGKNLISKDMYTSKWLMSDNINVDFTDSTGKLYSIYGIKPYGATKLVLSCNKSFNRLIYRGRDSANNVVYYGSLGTVNITNHTFESIPSNVVTLDLYVHADGIDESYDFMLEEADTINPYEPYMEFKQEVHLKEPLRSLPNGVCDELVGNKVIRRVGKLVLNGTENWVLNNNNSTTTNRFLLNSHINSVISGDITKYMCNTLPCIIWSQTATLGITITKGDIFICNKSIDYTVSAIKNWLSNNPTTVYYELATPIEEHLVNVYEKESIKTYQLDAPLRCLPNGVKDEIKDGVLIRRCGEIILDGSEEWKEPSSDKPTEESGFIRFNSPITGSKKSSYCLCDKFKYETGATVALEKIYITATPNISITVPKSKIANIEALKVWLQTNPTKVIYELDTHVEISLKEVKPQTADFSLDRQLAEGNYLRELPNGVKDTVENGKVIRRTKKLVLNGSENWTTSRFTEQSEFIGFELAGIGLKPGNRTNLVCDKFNVIETINQNNTCEGIQTSSTDDLLWIKIYKTRLTEQTIQGFKTWLQSNLITLIFELATPTEETLSTDNYMSYPSHEFNTYCGSMYVGEGRNYVISDNKMPTEDTIVVETDFREIEGKAKVEDCNFKKSDEGYDTPYISSSSKNLLDISTSNILTKDYSKNYRFNYTESNNGFTISNITANSYASIRFRVYLKAGVSYRIEYAQTGPYSSVDLKTLGLEFICNLNSNRVFKVTNSDYYSVNFYCTGSVSTTSTATFTDIRITEGETSVPFEPCNKTTKYLENTEENDVEDLRHLVSLTGFNYDKILNESFDKLLRGEL